MSTFERSKPKSICRAFPRPLMQRPAPTSSTSASATSATTRRVSQAVVRAPAPSAPALLEGLVETGTRGLERGHQAEEQAGRERRQQREAESLDRRADRRGRGCGRCRCSGRKERSERHHPAGEHDTQRAAERAPAAGSPCASWRTRRQRLGPGGQADGDLLLPARGPAQQQIGHVGRHDQQHPEAHDEQQAQRRAHDGLCAVGAVGEGDDAVMNLAVRPRDRPSASCASSARDGGPRLRQADARAARRTTLWKPRALREVSESPKRLPTSFEHRERRPELEDQARHRAAKLRRHDAHDRERVAVQVERPADDGRVAAEAPPPVGLADDDDRIAARLACPRRGERCVPRIGLTPRTSKKLAVTIWP